ncbi:MAG TPA: hypothetical protein VN936_08740, partial [Candidatus Acidoferrum sp.]|nr:hypothetical protein [Candidatus Acidoferrum sp.]
MGSNRKAALIVALLATTGCARSGPIASHAATPVRTAALGVPLYPGAKADAGGSFATRLANRIVEVAAFQTADSFERVEAFYRHRLPGGS